MFYGWCLANLKNFLPWSKSLKHSSESIEKYLYFYNRCSPFSTMFPFCFHQPNPEKVYRGWKWKIYWLFVCLFFFFCIFSHFFYVMLKGKFCLQFVDNNCVFCRSFALFIVIPMRCCFPHSFSWTVFLVVHRRCCACIP